MKIVLYSSMLYFFDTEFLENGVTIEPISIGICAEDGRELYLEFEYDKKKVNESEFLRNNVVPHLEGIEKLSRQAVAKRVLEFVGEDEDPQFWAWYAAYDWIVMCQLFGRMIDLPKHFPKFVRDLRQTCAERGIRRSSLPETPEKAHNALVDARWLKEAYRTSAILRLAVEHWNSDSGVSYIYIVDNNDKSQEIRFLEVTNLVTTTDSVIPFQVAPRPDLNFEISIALINDEEFSALRCGDLTLPDGWGEFTDLRMIEFTDLRGIEFHSKISKRISICVSEQKAE